MKAKDLAKLLKGVDPEAEVYIDLGIIHKKSKALVYEILTNADFSSAPIEQISLTAFSTGIKEVYLSPYDGQYDLEDDDVVDVFFKVHGLDKGWEERNR